MAKEGSTVSGLMDSFACAVIIALQHGVPLRLLVNKFAHTRFEPSGWTQNPEIGYANSIMDYIFRWLDLRFLSGEQQTCSMICVRIRAGNTHRLLRRRPLRRSPRCWKISPKSTPRRDTPPTR